eukprot:1838502-Rhodomonas_salina.1
MALGCSADGTVMPSNAVQIQAVLRCVARAARPRLGSSPPPSHSHPLCSVAEQARERGRVWRAQSSARPTAPACDPRCCAPLLAAQPLSLLSQLSAPTCRLWEARLAARRAELSPECVRVPACAHRPPPAPPHASCREPQSSVGSSAQVDSIQSHPMMTGPDSS